MSETYRILCLGDVVGKPGMQGIKRHLRDWRRQLAIDFVICNAENAVDGSGVTPAAAKLLLASGCDVLTSGDHAWKRNDFITCCEDPRILRPANFPDGGPGQGWGSYALGETRLGVINLMGQVFTRACDNPFRLAECALAAVADCPLIVVDMHAEATSEKAAMGYFLDGRVTAVFGTHTHVPTADEQILPKGTGFITDIGMCGPHHSIIGRKIEPVVEALSTCQQRMFNVATKDPRLNGVVIQIERGRCVGMERVRFDCPVE
jgi:2',3'-cyclic-nucleotide 2'-phosphodiesterase